MTDCYHFVLYDCKLKKPACTLLQAASGCGLVAQRFDPEHWLLAPTPDMHRYRVTGQQLRQLVGITEKTHGKRRA